MSRIPVPQLRRQVPDWWRTYFGRPLAALLYGAGLGVGFLTFLGHGTLVVVTVGAAATGRPFLGALVMMPFGLARGLAPLVGARSRDAEDGALLVDRLSSMSGRVRSGLNVAALLVVAVAAAAAASGSEGGWGRAAAATLAVSFAWASASKLFGWGRWRRALSAHSLPRGAERLAAWAVPAAESLVPILTVLGRGAGRGRRRAGLARRVLARARAARGARRRPRRVRLLRARLGGRAGGACPEPRALGARDRGVVARCARRLVRASEPSRAPARPARGGHGERRGDHGLASRIVAGKGLSVSPSRLLRPGAPFVAALLTIVLMAIGAGAHHTDLADPNDTLGKLDVRRVRFDHTGAASWTLTTFSEWTTGSIWDRGYLLVMLDTEAGAPGRVLPPGSLERRVPRGLALAGPAVRVRHLPRHGSREATLLPERDGTGGSVPPAVR